MRKILISIITSFFLLIFSSSIIRANYSCTYRTWNSEGNLYFQMVTYPNLWDYTHIYFDTTSTEPTSANNDNESSWNLGTWNDYNNSWQDKWCGIKSGTGYDMGCNSNNWPATMPNPIWTFTGVSQINQVYIATGLDANSSNPVCTLTNETPAPSPSPTLTPIPIPTPTPIYGPVLFQDDFETDRSYQWQIIDGAWTRQHIQGSNRYGLILPIASSYAEVQGGDFNWTNYEFSFDMLPIQGADRNILFRVNDQRSTVVPNLNLPVGYGLHMYSYYMWLQKFTTTSAEDLVGAPIPLPNNTSTHFRIQVVNNEIKVFLGNDTTPTIDYTDDNGPHLSGRIALSETTGTIYPTEVWFDNIVVTSLDPTPLPVTKTVLVPGLGASWNAEAFLGCQNNTSSEWNLSSFAEDIYNPIIQTLTDSGWTTLPFYYDWRQAVSTNSERLTNYINESSTQGEKVNLVGHSMGGLVGRGYLEDSSGGRLSNLLTIGAPNKGSALAYPPWESGNLWSDNFIEKIAITLYLKHCGGIGPADKDTIQNTIPSLKDLLPTEPYLQKINTTTLYLPTNPDNQNTWLRDLSDNSWGVRLGYIAGTGFETLKTIRTKDPNKRDSRLGNWEDGKPAGKIFSPDGDGTVLADSAILPNADTSYSINQTHEGLINSIEGMSKILEFLGTPQISNQQTLLSSASKVNSALIVIANPASFFVTDQNGKTKVAKDGMVSFMNPRPGNYKLNLLPKSNNSLLIIAQFLPNGDVKYKEYKLNGLGPKFKTLKFDLQNPQEDILMP